MESNVCEVNIDNQNYFIPCDRVKDLHYNGEYLINVSSSSITMRARFEPDTSYPYISCSSMNVCTLRTAYNSYTEVRSDYSYNGDYFKIADYNYLILCLLFIILGVRLVWKR